MDPFITGPPLAPALGGGFLWLLAPALLHRSSNASDPVVLN